MTTATKSRPRKGSKLNFAEVFWRQRVALPDDLDFEVQRSTGHGQNEGAEYIEAEVAAGDWPDSDWWSLKEELERPAPLDVEAAVSAAIGATIRLKPPLFLRNGALVIRFERGEPSAIDSATITKRLGARPGRGDGSFEPDPSRGERGAKRRDQLRQKSAAKHGTAKADQDGPPEAAAPPAEEDRTIPLDQIEPSPTNPRKRFDEVKLQELAQSIREKGLLQAILVRPKPQGYEAGLKANGRSWAVWMRNFPGDLPHHVADADSEESARAKAAERNGPPRFELVAGERRFRAAKLAGLAAIRATVRVLDDKAVAEIQLIENGQREDIDPIEEAHGYRLLIEKYGYSAETIAAKVGKSKGHVYGTLKLAELPAKAQEAFIAGALPRTTALLIARVPSLKARVEAAKIALEKDYRGNLASYREVKEAVERRFMIELKQAPFSPKDAQLCPSAGACTDCPKRTGNNRDEYPDARADVCTDPECYRDKVKAWGARQAAAAQAEGKRVLSDAEAKKVFSEVDGERVRYDGAYLDLAKTEWVGSKQKSVKQLCGEAITPDVVLAFDRQGRLHQLVPKAKAQPLINKALGRGNGASQTPSGDDRKKRMAENRLRTETLHGMLASTAWAVEKAFRDMPSVDPLINQILRELIVNKTEQMWGASLDDVCARHQWKGKHKGERVKALQASLGNMNGQQLMGLLVELDAVPDLVCGDKRGYRKVLQIDRKLCETDARQRLKTKGEPKVRGQKRPLIETDLEKVLEDESEQDARNRKRNGKSAEQQLVDLGLLTKAGPGNGQPYDNALLKALYCRGDDTWGPRIRSGASDAEIVADLKSLWAGEKIGGAGPDYEYATRQTPAFWASFAARGRPTLKGKELVSAVRRVLSIYERNGRRPAAQTAGAKA